MPDTRDGWKGLKEFFGRLMNEVIAEGAIAALRSPPPAAVVVAAPGGAATPTVQLPPAPAGAAAQAMNLVTAAGFDLKAAAAAELGPEARDRLNQHFVGKNTDAEAAILAIKALGD